MALPTKNGVGPSCIVLPAGPWLNVLDFLAERFDTIPREEIAARMMRGDVLDAQGALVLPAHRYQPQLKLFYYRSIEQETPIPFEEVVLFQDELLLAVDKPHYLPVTPGGRYLQETLLVRLKRKLGIADIAPVHRIDRETAGVVLFTLQPKTRGIYQALFSERVVTKQYQAVAPWRADIDFPMRYRSRLGEAEHFMRMREEDGEANSETMIGVLEAKGALARYRLSPLSGKKHQLRVHMASLGMPILNDQIYPEHFSKDEIEKDDFSRPLQLLAESLSFRDPVTGQAREFTSGRQLLPL
ncbi:MAG: pseudouridine synthase [Betaproteobacteria bacterium]